MAKVAHVFAELRPDGILCVNSPLSVIDAGLPPLINQASCDVKFFGHYTDKEFIKLQKYPFCTQDIVSLVLLHFNEGFEVRGVYAVIIE